MWIGRCTALGDAKPPRIEEDPGRFAFHPSSFNPLPFSRHPEARPR